MKPWLLGLLLLGSIPPIAAKDNKIQAREILDRIDDIWRGQSSHSTFSMEIVSTHWRRKLKMQNYSLGKDYSLIIIEQPKKEKGTATLKIKNDIWNYLPKTDRTIKLPPSMLLAQWMGSHFTNDDLVKDSRMADDYDYDITFEGDRQGRKIYEITLIPKAAAAVVWGKIVVEVEQKELMPLRQVYYDENGNKARQSEFADFKMMDGKLIPCRMTITPVDKPGESTTVITDHIDFDIGITPAFFSLQQIRQQRP